MRAEAQFPPLRDVLRFFGKAAATTATAAQVVTRVADSIQGTPSSADQQRALRDLADQQAELELQARQLEATLQRLLEEELQDDSAAAQLAARVADQEQRIQELERFMEGLPQWPEDSPEPPRVGPSDYRPGEQAVQGG